MKELIIYQFEVACCLFALTLLYFVFWKKETNFQMKRIFILSIPMLAFIIPWLDFNINLSREQTLETIQYFTELPTHFIVPDIILDGPEYKAESMSVWQIMFWVWLSGIIAMTIRVSVSYYNIWKIYRNSVKPIGYSYRVVNEPIQSFSFFSFIALNKHH